MGWEQDDGGLMEYRPLDVHVHVLMTNTIRTTQRLKSIKAVARIQDSHQALEMTDD
jgi:hypothetical protein